jgi:hypothetical protein
MARLPWLGAVGALMLPWSVASAPPKLSPGNSEFGSDIRRAGVSSRSAAPTAFSLSKPRLSTAIPPSPGLRYSDRWHEAQGARRAEQEAEQQRTAAYYDRQEREREEREAREAALAQAERQRVELHSEFPPTKSRRASEPYRNDAVRRNASGPFLMFGPARPLGRWQVDSNSREPAVAAHPSATRQHTGRPR